MSASCRWLTARQDEFHKVGRQEGQRQELGRVQNAELFRLGERAMDLGSPASSLVTQAWAIATARIKDLSGRGA